VIRIRPPAANSISITLPASECAVDAKLALTVQSQPRQSRSRQQGALGPRRRRPSKHLAAPAAARNEEIRMSIMSTRDPGDLRPRRQCILDYPELFSGRPSTSPLRARKTVTDI
jgi:hypothetical protein